ncbi:T9SS type A sorting domain-containing protein [Brumimicrobium glaciale]|uniref:T9SS type A sorting domain-containing protein n=1 Tax=Brumimicrobium glaciale TaxID=200475 RepID=A0A4Q4KRS4_9FLAO|nr:T9SS type A sorting domain-containing protein [Brumimicrobium glaciale]RYM35622.1 T9SS type A sorting domain-containing protein [Brumimicrobium glaciale]
MKSKIKYTIITILLTISTSSFGQFGFLGANYTYQIQGNNLQLFSEVGFSYGSGSSCPRIDTVIVSKINNVISIDLYFDTRAFWTLLGCNAYDTTSINFINVDTNLTAVLVNTNLIRYGATENDSTHLKVQTDTLILGSLSIVENFLDNDIRLFPNPASNKLNFTLKDNSNSIQLEIIDVTGNQVKAGRFLNQENGEFKNAIDISDLKKGLYFCKFSNGDKQVTRKFIKQ